MKSGWEEACQVTRTLQHSPSFLWGTAQKHRLELGHKVVLYVWPCCSSPFLRTRVSVPAVRGSCMWAAPPEQNGGRAGSRDQQPPCKSGLPLSILLGRLQHWRVALRHHHVPSPAPRGWGGGLGSCRYLLVHVPHPTEHQWMLDGQM